MFTLINLPYTLDALAPAISAVTMRFHHGRHLKGYVDNLNKLIAGTEYEALCHSESSSCHSERSEESILEEIVCKSDGVIFNNAGQILNHNLYFTQFKRYTPAISGPTGKLKEQIEKQWGTVEGFQTEFVAKGVSLFGSGWVWVSAATDGSLVITQESGANNPVTKGLKPLLTFDVWEHAYYLDYQNMRAAHLQELWKIVDWRVVENRFNQDR